MDKQNQMDESQFRGVLVKLVQAHWDSSKNPLLLADVPGELRVHEQLDYKRILGKKRLKAFLEEPQSDEGYKLIQHPTQKAKLALIPFNEDFRFPDVPDSDANAKQREDLSGDYRRVTLDFLRVVNSLSDRDQSEIIIPARIIAKLLS